jgi:hypothetical protein
MSWLLIEDASEGLLGFAQAPSLESIYSRSEDLGRRKQRDRSWGWRLGCGGSFGRLLGEAGVDEKAQCEKDRGGDSVWLQAKFPARRRAGLHGISIMKKYTKANAFLGLGQ